MNDIEQITFEKLCKTFGATERWWQRNVPKLLQEGVVSKRGRLFFGCLTDVGRWLHVRHGEGVNVQAERCGRASLPSNSPEQVRE